MRYTQTGLLGQDIFPDFNTSVGANRFPVMGLMDGLCNLINPQTCIDSHPASTSREPGVVMSARPIPSSSASIINIDAPEVRQIALSCDRCGPEYQGVMRSQAKSSVIQ